MVVKESQKTETNNSKKTEFKENKSDIAQNIAENVVVAEKEDVESKTTKKEILETKDLTISTKQTNEFNWDLNSQEYEEYSKEERAKLEKMYDKTLNSVIKNEVIDGTVVEKTNRDVVVNIGYKSDGIISLSEFRYNPDIKVGDKVEVYVESQEDKSGQLILSHKTARALRAWQRINKAFETSEIINGYIKCRTKGGMIVDVFGIETFLPGSQIDVRPIRDYDTFVGKTMEFKVVKINKEFKNVVVSHKALIESELEGQRAEIIAKLEKGQILEGSVKNITSYGAFIDLGGVDGLVHITDLSWGRINHPDEVLKLDQKINVVILDFDEEKKRIALGLKQLTPHPWDSLDEKLKIGDKVKGKIVVVTDYGAFLEIAPNVEGLIHVSEMSWSQHLRSAQDFLKVDNEIEAVILTLDREDKKMSLGIKQLKPDPWKDVINKYPISSKHTAVVRNFTSFGIFVELEEGVDGLIHISDLSWSKKINHPAEFTKIGAEIDVIVLDVDADSRRLSLGHKQLEENPWDVFETVFTIDSIHKGTIVSKTNRGVIIALPYGVEGFAPDSHIIKKNNAKAKVDETLEFKVIEFSKENKKIILSHSKIYQDIIDKEKTKETTDKEKKQTTTKTIKKDKKKLEKGTFGDVKVLNNLKSEKKEETKDIKKDDQKKKKPQKKVADKKDKVEDVKKDSKKKNTPKKEVADKKDKVEDVKKDSKKKNTPKKEVIDKEKVKKQKTVKKTVKKTKKNDSK